MEKIALDVLRYCFKGALCATFGYVLGGLTSDSISESDLKFEQDIILMNRYLENDQRRVEELEKSLSKRTRTSL